MFRRFAFIVFVTVWPLIAHAEPRSGIDLSAIDPAVRPQDDFWRFGTGKWLDATAIPADRAAWDNFSALRETTQAQLRKVIEDIDRGDPAHPERRKVADFYASFMDEAAVAQAGLEGLRDTLSQIRGLRDRVELPALFAEMARLWVRTPWELDVFPDEHDATVYIAHLAQGRLGLPDRDYYLSDTPHFQEVRAAYRAHIIKLLSLAGEAQAGQSADGILALETRLARLQWTRVDNRDPIKTYTRMAVSELPPLLDKRDLPAYLAATGVGADFTTLVVVQPSYFGG